MKKLYTLMLSAASASMMFAGMPMMQQHVAFEPSAPVFKSAEKTEMVKLYNQTKSVKHFNAFNSDNQILKAPSRAQGGLTRDDLCKMDLLQSFTPYFSNTLDQEFWGDVYFTPGKGANEIKLTGLFGYQDYFYGNISLDGTFDEANQTVSFPYEQLVYQSMQYKFYFVGFGLQLSEDKTSIVGEAFDLTAEDSLVFSIKEYGGQYGLRVEGAWDNSWDVIPAFGLYAYDTKNNGLGFVNLTFGEWFFMAEPNADITYKYIHLLDNTGQNYEILDYYGKGFFNIMQLEEDGDSAIQMGPFIQTRYGCPVMFTLDFGDYVAYDTFVIGNKEYPNPALIEGEDYFYLNELTETSPVPEIGIYLQINADEEGYFESCDFDCMSWAAISPEGYWFGECGPAHIQPIDFEVAGVNEIVADQTKDNRWFNLQGMEVNKANLIKGNIYINNGKKVLVK